MDSREALAAYAHEAWSGWVRYMLDNWTPDNLARWRRQMDTPYSELFDDEKTSDRAEADKILAVMNG